MLIHKYYPVDYCDAFTKEVKISQAITPEMFLNMTFSTLPGWIAWLLWLRNKVVALFGLKIDGRLIDMAREQDEHEIVLGMDDKHLTFYVSLWCSPVLDNSQNLKFTTLVKYNNRWGRIYFMIIRPFHTLIVKSMLGKVGKSIN